MKIENLYPEKVFHYFSEISKIPRGSRKEKKISDSGQGIECINKKACNSWI